MSVRSCDESGYGLDKGSGKAQAKTEAVLLVTGTGISKVLYPGLTRYRYVNKLVAVRV